MTDTYHYTFNFAVSLKLLFKKSRKKIERNRICLYDRNRGSREDCIPELISWHWTGLVPGTTWDSRWTKGTDMHWEKGKLANLKGLGTNQEKNKDKNNSIQNEK